MPNDEFLAPSGRVMEMLSEHQCEGWFEGYLLTGRHGLFNCYEAFIHIVDSMFNQHAKWLKVTAGLPWLERHPRWTFHFTPTSASWLNAVEGHFAKLSKRRLKRGVFCWIIELQAAIDRFLAETNWIHDRSDGQRTPEKLSPR